jgi:hypothetical protein
VRAAGADKITFEITFSTNQKGALTFFDALAEVLKKYNGRPHLGKTIRPSDVTYAAQVVAPLLHLVMAACVIHSFLPEFSECSSAGPPLTAGLRKDCRRRPLPGVRGHPETVRSRGRLPECVTP